MSSASIEASATALDGSASRDHERQERGRDQRTERGIRPQHEDARWAEQRIREERQDRRVQAGDGRETGQFGVGHSLGNE